MIMWENLHEHPERELTAVRTTTMVPQQDRDSENRDIHVELRGTMEPKMKSRAAPGCYNNKVIIQNNSVSLYELILKKTGKNLS